MATIDIGVSKEELLRIAKDTVREMVQSQIEAAMKQIDLQAVIQKKIAGIDDRILKIADKQVKELVESLKYRKDVIFKQAAHDAVMEEISKKPLSGNVYLKLVVQSADSEYGSSNW